MKIETLAMAIAKQNGGFDTPESKAFQLKNPGLLKTYRPEKKTDEDHIRVFSSTMGGFKALVADIQVKCEGKNRDLTVESPLRDLLAKYGFITDSACRPVLLFVKRGLADESISLNTPLSYFQETV